MSRVYKVQGSAVCEVCGNTGCQCFEVQIGGERHIFDSFECALDVLTPQCTHCGTPFVGQGVHVDDAVYCSYECANAALPESFDVGLDFNKLNDLYKKTVFQDLQALT